MERHDALFDVTGKIKQVTIKITDALQQRDEEFEVPPFI